MLLILSKTVLQDDIFASFQISQFSHIFATYSYYVTYSLESSVHSKKFHKTNEFSEHDIINI